MNDATHKERNLLILNNFTHSIVIADFIYVRWKFRFSIGLRIRFLDSNSLWLWKKQTFCAIWVSVSWADEFVCTKIHSLSLPLLFASLLTRRYSQMACFCLRFQTEYGKTVCACKLIVLLICDTINFYCIRFLHILWRCVKIFQTILTVLQCFFLSILSQ